MAAWSAPGEVLGPFGASGGVVPYRHKLLALSALDKLGKLRRTEGRPFVGKDGGPGLSRFLLLPRELYGCGRRGALQATLRLPPEAVPRALPPRAPEWTAPPPSYFLSSRT